MHKQSTSRRTIGLAAALAVLTFNVAGAEPSDFCYGAGNGSCAPPSEWPGACNAPAGKPRQSPVDIFDSQRGRLPELVFRYRATPLKVLSNGHTVEVSTGLAAAACRSAARAASCASSISTPRPSTRSAASWHRWRPIWCTRARRAGLRSWAC